MKKFMQLVSLLLVFCLLAGCQKNAEGRRALRVPDMMVVPQSFQAFEEQKKKVPMSKNRKQTIITKRVGERIIAVAKKLYPEECKGFKWEVQLFDEPKTVNAYCMPGGKIGIYTGILPVCQNEAALAAVMGHEVAHALLKHGNERVAHQLGASGALLAAQFGLSQSKKLSGDMKNAILSAAGVGINVGAILPYSRFHESEADRMGLFMLAHAGYDPNEAPELWRRMKAKSGGKAPPPFLSTHPSNDKRIKKLTELQKEVRSIYAKSKKYGKGDRL
ncbi:MAG: M48 family metallopeptidase [Planctomycetes bacterium]|nr:M48 family metallopeptidase [Planctomycetota bacterium]